MDTAILLAAIFHILEWVRTTILLTVVLVGVNLMWFWYFSGILSATFGLGSFIYLIAVYAGDAQMCNDTQPTRVQWLMVEVLYFGILFFIYQIPFLILRCFKKTTL